MMRSEASLVDMQPLPDCLMMDDYLIFVCSKCPQKDHLLIHYTFFSIA